MCRSKWKPPSICSLCPHVGNSQDHIFDPSQQSTDKQKGIGRTLLGNDMVVFSTPTGGAHSAIIAQYLTASNVPLVAITTLSKLLLPNRFNFFLQPVAQLHCCLAVVASPSIQFIQPKALQLQQCFVDEMTSAVDPVGILALNQQRGAMVNGNLAHRSWQPIITSCCISYGRAFRFAGAQHGPALDKGASREESSSRFDSVFKNRSNTLICNIDHNYRELAEAGREMFPRIPSHLSRMHAHQCRSG